jgi:hypothetical protein
MQPAARVITSSFQCVKRCTNVDAPILPTKKPCMRWSRSAAHAQEFKTCHHTVRYRELETQQIETNLGILPSFLLKIETHLLGFCRPKGVFSRNTYISKGYTDVSDRK